jgi:hypothetical protein
MLCALIIVLSGCGGEVGNFMAGFGTGVVATLNEADNAVTELRENIKVINEKSTELEIAGKELKAELKVYALYPELLVNALDPKLAEALKDFMYDLKALKEEAEIMKDESGKIDWEQLALAALLSGVGVDKFKMWRKTG